jgi:hypothetical protein
VATWYRRLARSFWRIIRAAPETIFLPIVSGGVAVWVTTQVVRGFQLDGSMRRQALALAVAAVLYPVLGTLPIIGIPVGLWLSVVVCQWLDLPLRVSGFWPFVVGAVVCYVVAEIHDTIWDLLTAGGGQDRLVRLAELIVLVGGVGVFWLLVVTFDAIRIDDGAGWRQSLIIVVLGALFVSVVSGVHLSASLAPISFLIVAGILWLVSWFSTGLVLTLEVAGFGTFALAGLLGAVAMWVVKLPLRAESGTVEEKFDSIFASDPFAGRDHYWH